MGVKNLDCDDKFGFDDWWCLDLWCDFWWVRWESDFLDDWIAGNAWFLWVKLGWSGCFVLNNLYWFFEDFKWVRFKLYFIRVERYFEDIFDDFWWCWNGGKHWFFNVLSNSVSNSKLGFRCGNNRCALSGNRTFVLKCKPTGDIYRTNVLEDTIIVQYYSIFFVQLVFCTFLQLKI